MSHIRGRFHKAADKSVTEYTASISFDRRLYRHDIAGSIAHTKMLAKQGIISEKEAETIINGLAAIREEIEQGKFQFKPELEDIHMSIEARLLEKVGEVGGKLHTARSRNDQVALDLRLFTKEAISETIVKLKEFQQALISLAEANKGVIMPGYTHLQPAQPVLLAHHLLAYFEMLQRDIDRFNDCYTTGSSIMPQKKNPDVAELVRGKTGRVYGRLMAWLVTMKALPLAYNRDMQEDKEGFFDTVDTLLSTLGVFTGMVKTLRVKAENTEQAARQGYILATDLADYLVKKGEAFRTAHQIVARLVSYAMEKGKSFSELSPGEYKEFSPLFGEDVYSISLESSVAARDVIGGTGPKQVDRALAAAKKLLGGPKG